MTNRYKNTKTINPRSFLNEKPKFVTANLLSRIYKDCQSGRLATTRVLFKEGDRLDYLSQTYYGNGLDWWIIAGASGIGWWLQINPGTEIIIPTDLKQVKSLYNL